MTDNLLSRSPTSFFATSSFKTQIGSFIFANGDRYEGEYIVTSEGQLMRHGYGKHINVNQQYNYEGSWHHDKMHGIGLLTFVDGSSYKGEFQTNFFHGRGTYTWSDGSQYNGLWQWSRAIGNGEYLDSKLGMLFMGSANRQEIRMRYKVNHTLR